MGDDEPAPERQQQRRSSTAEHLARAVHDVGRRSAPRSAASLVRSSVELRRSPRDAACAVGVEVGRRDHRSATRPVRPSAATSSSAWTCVPARDGVSARASIVTDNGARPRAAASKARSSAGAAASVATCSRWAGQRSISATSAPGGSASVELLASRSSANTCPNPSATQRSPQSASAAARPPKPGSRPPAASSALRRAARRSRGHRDARTNTGGTAAHRHGCGGTRDRARRHGRGAFAHRACARDRRVAASRLDERVQPVRHRRGRTCEQHHVRAAGSVERGERQLERASVRLLSACGNTDHDRPGRCHRAHPTRTARLDSPPR